VDPVKVLQSEGVEFDDHDRANPNQRISISRAGRSVPMRPRISTGASDASSGARSVTAAPETTRSHSASNAQPAPAPKSP
jgi:hypothetical protein